MGSKPYPCPSFSNVCLFLCNLLFLTFQKNLVMSCRSVYSGYTDNRQDQTISSEADLKKLAGRLFFSIFILWLLQLSTN